MMHNSALGHGLAIGDIPEEVVLPETMTAAVIDAPGDCSVLHLATVPTPTAINAEFAVKVIAAGSYKVDLVCGSDVVKSNYATVRAGSTSIAAIR